MKILRYLQDCSTVSYSQPKDFKIHIESKDLIAYDYQERSETCEVGVLFENIWIACGIVNMDKFNMIEVEGVKERFKSTLLDSAIEESFFVRKQLFELVRMLPDSFFTSNGTTKEERLKVLETIHTNHLVSEQLKEEQKVKEKLERKLKEERELSEKCSKNLTLLKEGKSISWFELGEIINQYNISIHPRTKGFLNEHIEKIPKSLVSLNQAVFVKGKGNKTIQNFFEFLKINFG